MRDIHLGNDDSTTNPDSDKLGGSEEVDQSKDEKTTSESNPNDLQPSATAETSGDSKRKHTQ